MAVQIRVGFIWFGVGWVCGVEACVGECKAKARCSLIVMDVYTHTYIIICTYIYDIYLYTHIYIIMCTYIYDIYYACVYK